MVSPAKQQLNLLAGRYRGPTLALIDDLTVAIVDSGMSKGWVC